MLIGAIIGMVIRFLTTAEHLKYYVTFDVNFFYLILIPPIIFESGYTMKRVSWFFFFNQLQINFGFEEKIF